MMLVQKIIPPFSRRIRRLSTKWARQNRRQSRLIASGMLYAAQTVQHRLLVTRNLRGKFGKRGKLLLGADLKQQLQPQKFPVEIAGKAEQRRFGHRLRQLVDRRVDAEIDRRGKPSKLPCVCPAAIDAEGRH